MNQGKIKEFVVKSLLTSLYQREELPLFGKEGLGEIFGKWCLVHYGLLSYLGHFRSLITLDTSRKIWASGIRY